MMKNLPACPLPARRPRRVAASMRLPSTVDETVEAWRPKSIIAQKVMVRKEKDRMADAPLRTPIANRPSVPGWLNGLAHVGYSNHSDRTAPTRLVRGLAAKKALAM